MRESTFVGYVSSSIAGTYVCGIKHYIEDEDFRVDLFVFISVKIL